jgi:hypothetical protein
MHRFRASIVTAVLLLAAALCSCATLTPPPSRNPVPPLDAKNIRRVIVLILENGSPVEAAQQPFMKFVEQRGTRLDQYYGVAHPSQPNYVALISGSTAGALTDKPLTLDRPHIGQTLGDRWRVYAEDYPALPGRCNLAKTSGAALRGYARRHVPFLSFRDVQQGDCAQIVRLNTADAPIGALASDIRNGTLPDFALIIPNLQHDGHEPSNVQNANEWLVHNIQPLFADPKFTDGTLFVLTFDEDDSSGKPNRVYTAIAGDAVKPGGVSTDVYDHEDLLATIAALLHVTPPAFDEPGVRPIGGVWKQG